MLRVREVPVRALPRDGEAVPVGSAKRARSARSRAGRWAAVTVLGIAIGSGGMVLTASLVQADDDAGIRSFFLEEAARKAARAPAQSASYASARPTAYAPAGNGWRLPLLQMQPNGRIAHPPIQINPFRQAPKKVANRQHKPADAGAALVSAHNAQTFCVRLCDGFHAPLGLLRSASDMGAHDALCKAMNPGIPVKVFRAAAGSTSIDNAVAADGQRYAALPMAYSHEKAADRACRPAIVQAGERRISLLRDITLRPGDSVVLDGKVSTFAGGSSWPYSRRDFRDFRTASELTKGQRQQIDERVGISRMEADASSLRRQMRVREARLQDDDVVSDAVLRGSLDPTSHAPVRLIPITTASR